MRKLGTLITRFELLRILLTTMIPLVLACAQNESPSGPGLEGIISVSPAHPGPSRVDTPNSAPLAGVTFAVENDKSEVASFTTDEQGRFRLSLPAGHYTVRVKQARIRRCSPFSVEVVDGKMTKVEWGCDSGMR